MVDIHLNIDTSEKRLAVPRFYWKIVYNPINNQGVAVIGVNNIHLKAIILTNSIPC